MRLDSGALPKEAGCIRAFDLMGFVLSPFAHYETTPKKAMEDRTRAFNQATADLADAVEADEGPDRTKNTEIAARWYLGLPQLISETLTGKNSQN